GQSSKTWAEQYCRETISDNDFSNFPFSKSNRAWLEMVKLHYRVIKRKYKQDTYPHPECNLNLPVELHEPLRFFWNRNVTLEIKIEGDTAHIFMRRNPEP
ncbi:MAG TPA: hypothetical protein VF893_06265, partial [Candidatus Bathyarchaeia archaeon]